MIRYAVVGAGWISQEAFLPGARQATNSKVVALVSGDLAKARTLADLHGIEHVVDYAGYDELLASDLIDAVYIALPNSMHCDYTVRAARAGKHVMVEKPIANSVEEAQMMIDAARDHGVLLMTAYRLHNEPGTLAVLDHIRRGTIGEPLFFQSVFSFQMAPGNHRLKAEHWGGPLQDVGVYCVNAARHVFGEEPIEAHAIARRPLADGRFGEVDATVAATLRFPSGGIAQFICSFGAGPVDNYRVIGTKGDIELDPGFKFETATRMRFRIGSEIKDLPFPQVDQFGGQIDYFSECIMTGRRPEADGEEGLADLVVLLAIEASAQRGLPLALQIPARGHRPDHTMVRELPITMHRLLL